MGMVGKVTEPSALAGRQQLLDAINELLTELDQGIHWDNDDLSSFLEAMSALLGSIENSYTNKGEAVPADSWEIMSRVLRGARYYD